MARDRENSVIEGLVKFFFGGGILATTVLLITQDSKASR